MLWTKVSQSVQSYNRGFASVSVRVYKIPGSEGEPKNNNTNVSIYPILHNHSIHSLSHSSHIPDGSGEAAAELIRRTRPRQVMLEIDTSRFEAALKSLKSGQSQSAPSRADIAASIHGGLLGRELKLAVEAARETGSALYCIDRECNITQARMSRAILNPVVFKALLQYAGVSVAVSSGKIDVAQNLMETSSRPIMTSSPINSPLGKQVGAQMGMNAWSIEPATNTLSGQGNGSLNIKPALSPQDPFNLGNQLAQYLKSICPPAHEILLRQRAQYMAVQIASQAVDDEKVLVLCGAPLVKELSETLSNAKKLEEAFTSVTSGEITRKGASLWWLVIALYLVLPVSILGSLWLGGVRLVLDSLRSAFGIPTEDTKRSSKKFPQPTILEDVVQ